jgi:hypothetical protein
MAATVMPTRYSISFFPLAIVFCTRRVRVTYHYAEDRHERRGPLPRDALVVELAALDTP